MLPQIIHLFQLSDKFKRLSVAKKHTFTVIEHYALSDVLQYKKYAENMLNCSRNLKLRVSLEPTEEGWLAKSSIEDARWCRVRHCPMCQLAKSSKRRALLFKSFEKADLSKSEFAFLTLTIRNRPLSQLRTALGEMTKAWDKLSRRKTFPVVGFLRGMEVTMQRERLPKDKTKSTGNPVRSSEGELMAHPHFHILLQMKDGYFTSDFKNHQWWVSQWRSALKVDYDPSVSIKKVNKDSDFYKSLLETVKYTTKPSEFSDLEGAEWLYGLTEQLHGLRDISVGGTISEICSQEELNRIDDSLKSEDEKSQFGDLIEMNWNDSKNKWDVIDPRYSHIKAIPNCV